MSALPTPTYYPRTGSKGALALAHLRAHGRTSRMDLADAIECPAKDLSADIRMCLEHGLITKEIEVDGRVFYGLGDGVPPAAPVEDVPEPGLELAATRWIDLKAEPMAIRALEGVADLEPGETPADVISAAQAGELTGSAGEKTEAAGPARFAIWNDGDLEIIKNGRDTVLDEGEARALKVFLDRHYGEGA